MEERLKNQETMTTKAYDIRTKDAEYQRKLEEQYQVKNMTTNDYLFYEDICHGTFKFSCCSTVSASWLKQNRQERRQRSLEKRRMSKGLERELQWDEYCFQKTRVVNLWLWMQLLMTYIQHQPIMLVVPWSNNKQQSKDDHQKQKFPQVNIRK